jgi:hypothetical protein
MDLYLNMHADKILTAIWRQLISQNMRRKQIGQTSHKEKYLCQPIREIKLDFSLQN